MNAPKVAAWCLALVACAPVALAGPDCTSLATGVALSGDLAESSGVALGPPGSGLLWTHNDDGSRLFAIDTLGTIVSRHAVRPRLRDWEDLAVGGCGDGERDEVGERCLYLADTGDNGERRSAGSIDIVRVHEPAPGESELRGTSFPLRLPDGPRDIEALFVLPGERLFLVTKGRNHPVTVYRYPGPLRTDTVTLEEVQRLTTGPVGLGDLVTGGAASADGRTVALRTYQSLRFYRPEGDTLVAVPNGLVNLRTLREGQGEAVALGPEGLVVLTSERGPFGGAATLNLLRCRI